MSLALLLWLALVYYKIMSFQFTTHSRTINEKYMSANEMKTNKKRRRRREKKLAFVCYLIAPFLVLNLSNKNWASCNNAYDGKRIRRNEQKKEKKKKRIEIYCNKGVTDSVSLCVDSQSCCCWWWFFFSSSSILFFIMVCPSKRFWIVDNGCVEIYARK